jgi:hypothetical protein
VATGCFICFPASPPCLAKAVRSGPGTRQPDQVIERWRWNKGSSAEERGDADMVRRQRSKARGGVQDLAMALPSAPMASGASGLVKRIAMEQGGGRIG